MELTNRGRDVLASASRFHRRTERELVKAHGPEAVATLRALLASIAGPAAEATAPSCGSVPCDDHG